jgi:hypothetical protein
VLAIYVVERDKPLPTAWPPKFKLRHGGRDAGRSAGRATARHDGSDDVVDLLGIDRPVVQQGVGEREHGGAVIDKQRASPLFIVLGARQWRGGEKPFGLGTCEQRDRMIGATEKIDGDGVATFAESRHQPGKRSS